MLLRGLSRLMKQTDLAYTAGIIDGEGCISIYRMKVFSHLALRVSVSSTDEWLCQFLKFSFGGHIYGPRRRGHNKPCWEWRITSAGAGEFLRLILPYLRLKRPQAELAIKFQGAKGRSRKGLTEEERALEEAQKILLSSLKRPNAKDDIRT